MKNLYIKLLEAQKRIGAISKDSTNPFFKSKYFDINTLIEEVKPVMNELGLIILQPLVFTSENKPAISTILVDAESGEEFKTMTPLLENPDPQKFGSVVTYFRRYALQSLLCLSAEDDDANIASGENTEKPWLTELQYRGMLSAIESGNSETVIERMDNYKIKKEYREELNRALEITK